MQWLKEAHRKDAIFDQTRSASSFSAHDGRFPALLNRRLKDVQARLQIYGDQCEDYQL